MKLPFQRHHKLPVETIFSAKLLSRALASFYREAFNVEHAVISNPRDL